MIVVHSTHPGWLSNAYLIAPRDGGDAVVVDSGAPLGPIFETIVARGLRLRAVLTTHRHPDHVAGHPEIRRRTGAAILAIEGESEFVEGADPVRDGQELVWDGLAARALLLPGHTRFHAGFLVAGVGLFTGDFLFAGSFGSTFRAGPNGFEAARRALFDRVLGLPDETALYPGHGAATTVGRERTSNPFLRVLTGLDPEGTGPCRVRERNARLIVLARQFDGRTKAWVRFDDDGTDVVLPGREIEIERARLHPPDPRGAGPRPGRHSHLQIVRD